MILDRTGKEVDLANMTFNEGKSVELTCQVTRGMNSSYELFTCQLSRVCYLLNFSAEFFLIKLYAKAKVFFKCPESFVMPIIKIVNARY